MKSLRFVLPSKQTSMSGPQFLLSDLLQVYAQSGKSGCLKAFHEDLTGLIYLRRGTVVHAECKNLAGPKAFSLILRWGKAEHEWIEAEIPRRYTLDDEVGELLIRQAFCPEWTHHETAMLLSFGDPEWVDIGQEEEAPGVVFGFAVTGYTFEPFRFEFEIPEIIVGRVPEFCHVVVPDPSVSGKHGVFRLSPPQAHFQDFGSTNGSRVNSQLVTKYELRPGDIIQLGKTAFYFYQVDFMEGTGKSSSMPQEMLDKILNIKPTPLNQPSMGLMAAQPKGRKTLTTKVDTPEFRSESAEVHSQG